MKKKIVSRKYVLAIISLFIIGSILRLINFEDRLIFGPEQGMSLTTAASNLTKFTLLGETNFQRATSANHIPFHGAYYSYLLIPFLLLFDFRVLPITFVFVLLNLTTALVLFFVLKKIFGKGVALLGLFYFLFSAVMIHHSLFTWILNPLPLLGVLTIWFIYQVKKDSNKLTPAFWLGFLTGFGFGLQNLYLPFGIVSFAISLIFSKRRIKSVICYLFGGLFGSLSMVIFDLRHDFYHLRTFWQYFVDVFITKSVSGFTDYYHFLHMFPLLFLLLALATYGLYKQSKLLALVIPLVFLYTNLTSPFVDLNRSTGMPNGITLKSLELAAETIAADQLPDRFNVATLWDFDTLGRPMRYLLTYYHGLVPQEYDNYTNIDALYVFAPDSYDINNPRVWELNSFAPFEVRKLTSPSLGYQLYKLTK